MDKLHKAISMLLRRSLSRLGTAVLSCAILGTASPLLAAVYASSGDVELPPMTPFSVVLNVTESNSNTLLFQERWDTALSVPVSVDVSLPGQFNADSDLTPGVIAAGTRVDSWFMHADPTISAGFVGAVRFDRDILGVMVYSSTIVASNGVLGAALTVYEPTLGELEFTANDRLTLSPDRRLLTFDWSTNSRVDQIRIVTEATPIISSLANFAHLTTPATLGADSRSRLNNPHTNGTPAALVFMTQTISSGTALLGYMISPSGVWYDPSDQRWAWLGGSNLMSQHYTVFEPGPNSFLHVSDGTNTSLNSTYIDQPATNGNPQAKLLVTYNAGTSGTPIAFGRRIGVWYNSVLAKWAVYTEDQSPMGLGLSFNITVLPDDGASFVHTVTQATGTTMLDHPGLNGNPDALLQVTHVYNPVGVSGKYADYPFMASFLDNSWGIFRGGVGTAQPIEVGTSFNVYVPTANALSFQHQADALNVNWNSTALDFAGIHGILRRLMLETANWAPSVGGGVANPNSTGLWFDQQSTNDWLIFNQNGNAYPIGAASNLFAPGNDLRTYVHVADSTNIAGNFSRLQSVLTQGDPNAIVLATQTWNPSGNATGVYNPSNIGIWYDGTTWAVYNEDLAAMPVDAAFNIYVAKPESHAFVHTVTPVNSSGSTTTLDDLWANGAPDVRLIVTHNYNPGGAGGVYNDHPIAVNYDSALSRWQIKNQDGSPMPLGAAFNVVPVPEPNGLLLLGPGIALLFALYSRRARET